MQTEGWVEGLWSTFSQLILWTFYSGTQGNQIEGGQWMSSSGKRKNWPIIRMKWSDSRHWCYYCLLPIWKFLRNMYTSWLENERNNLGNIFGIKEFSPKSSFCLHLFQTLVLSILLLFFLEYPSTFIQHWVMHLCPVRIHMCRKENHHQRMFSWWKNALSVLFMSSVTQKKNC